jgi:hypothetical protein
MRPAHGCRPAEIAEEIAMRPDRLPARRFLTAQLLTGACLLGLLGASDASASIITLTVQSASGTGLTQGAVCSTSSGQTCPTDPTFAMTGSYPVSGTFTINTSSDTASFSLTLTQNATFGSETLAEGSTFSGSGINISDNGSSVSQVGGAVNGTANFLFSGLSTLEGTPAISAFNCTLGERVNSCGLSLGPNGTLLEDSSSNQYDSFLTFNVNTTVPLPAALWSLLGGSALLLLVLRPQTPGVPLRAA